jgi:hypothetical protein
MLLAQQKAKRAGGKKDGGPEDAGGQKAADDSTAGNCQRILANAGERRSARFLPRRRFNQHRTGTCGRTGVRGIGERRHWLALPAMAVSVCSSSNRATVYTSGREIQGAGFAFGIGEEVSEKTEQNDGEQCKPETRRDSPVNCGSQRLRVECRIRQELRRICCSAYFFTFFKVIGSIAGISPPSDFMDSLISSPLSLMTPS